MAGGSGDFWARPEKVLAACSVACLLVLVAALSIVWRVQHPQWAVAAQLQLGSSADILGDLPPPSGSSGQGAEVPARLSSGSAPEAGAAANEPGGAEKKTSAIKLFGSVEFRGTLKDLPKWERVLKEMSGKSIADALRAGGKESLLGRWNDIKAAHGPDSSSPVLEKAKVVNMFFNQWRYRQDPEVYRVPDYWATPMEFAKNSGDCEDYAIVKYYALKELGVDPASMRLVIVMETLRNIPHAVLAVYANGDAYLLDNLDGQSTRLPSHSQRPNYVPHQSMNEQFRWTHMKAKKK